MIDDEKPFIAGRLVAVVAIFLTWSLAVAGRAVQFQVFQHKKLSNLAVKTYERDWSIPAIRGFIYDSRMAELAGTVTLANIVADPTKIKDIQATAEKLGPALGLDSRVINHQIAEASGKRRLVISEQIPPGVARRIKDLELLGIYIEYESLRIYPNGNLACQTLGFINKEGAGAAGLESRYEPVLRGKEGKASGRIDAFGHYYHQEILTPPVHGNSLVLSIDRNLQNIAQRELTKGVKAHRAKGGVAIVMESDSGRVLALAGYPDFNCNAYNEYSGQTWRNRAVQDVFEPGSTFKVVVASAALNSQLVGLDERIDCENGSMKIAGHVFHDHKPYGLLTLQETLENSSNICSAKLGLRLGNKGLYAALHDFGFGSRTDIDLPGESKGRVRELDDWTPLSVPTISFGQEVSVTSMQILRAINTIANGGYRVRPSIVDRVIDDKGKTIRATAPERIRIIRAETAAAIATAFEGVILRGTGMLAALEGYRAAGKTGTAQKAGKGGYSRTRYVASFIGFAPLPNPRITVLVQIDEPKGAIYGGEVAAPIFQTIAQETLLMLQVPPDRNLLTSDVKTTSRFSASDRAGQSLD
jgi:cell division protein FtsI (penicillin-binding protein 3)